MSNCDTAPLAVYPDELYRAAATAPTVAGFDSVTAADLERYRQDGFLAIANAYTPAEVAAACQGLGDLVDGKCAEFKDLWFESWAKDQLAAMSSDQRLDAVRKLASFVAYDERLNAMNRHPALQSVVQRLLGGLVPQLFQDMALLKPPRGREKPWHQDKAYFDYPVDTPVVGVWIALDDVDPENGCMHLLAGQHRAGPRLHFQRRDWQICDTDMLGQAAVAVPLAAGGCLLFDGLLPHGTPTNHSSKRRRALQFHYAPAGVQKFTTDERLAIYGGEGRDVTC